MTELLQEAIAQTASLPADEQNFIAAMLLDNIRYARVWIDPTDENPGDEFFDALEAYEPAAGAGVARSGMAMDPPAAADGKGPVMLLRRFHKAPQTV